MIIPYIILCLCNFIQNFSVNGANNAVISTLERVFYLNSVQSGLFLALYDLATVFSSPLVGYLGSRYSSPIFFCLNMIIVGIGNVLIGSSNFIYRDNNYQINLTWYNTDLFQCQNHSCVQQERLSNSFYWAKAVLYIGNFINGFGSVALFTIGVTYIERLFSKQRATYCQGIYFAVGTLGGALGIVVTGQFLKLFTVLNPSRPLPAWLNSSHPLWIGCWWLPYFIYGACCLLMGFIVLSLPKVELQASDSQCMTIDLVKNIRFIFVVVANLFEGILIKGFVPFITKYFEYQHQIETSMATLITGGIALASVIIACPVGAYLINRFRWTPMQCACFCAIILTISSFLFLLLILFCPELHFEPSICTSGEVLCCQNIYRPVCEINQTERMFLSPCHFSCANDSNFISVSEMSCRFRPIPCTLVFILTMTGAAFIVFFTALIQVPLLQVLLYSVPLSYQNMALGLRQTIVRVLGQTTGPLLFGFVFDQSCIIWLTDCFARRTCKVYNNRRMGLTMALSGFLTRLISGFACTVVFLHWKFRNTTTQ